MAQGKLTNKEQEATHLIRFAEEYGLRLWEIPEERFISSGAEQRVYIVGDDYVLKLNDAIYYASWQEYLHNLLLHNYFFNDTAYELNGFYVADGVVYAVVKQAFVQADNLTDLNQVKNFLAANGFEKHKNNDYRNSDL